MGEDVLLQLDFAAFSGAMMMIVSVRMGMSVIMAVRMGMIVTVGMPVIVPVPVGMTMRVHMTVRLSMVIVAMTMTVPMPMISRGVPVVMGLCVFLITSRPPDGYHAFGIAASASSAHNDTSLR